MIAQLTVLLRYLLVILFGALGGFLVAKGILTEDQASLLTSAEFIGAMASFGAAALTYLYYLFFSDASKALADWMSDRNP